MDESIKKARDVGYVTTMFGRRRYLPDIHSRNQVVRGNAERNAINAPIQGSAADIIKIAMVRIHEKMKSENFRSLMVLQVHDELIFEVEMPELEKVKELVMHEMSNAVKLDVPLKVDWYDGVTVQRYNGVKIPGVIPIGSPPRKVSFASRSFH
jgi:DNA polymerase-1